MSAFYLRQFTTGAGKPLLYVYERNKEKPFHQRPEKAAIRTNYYSLRRPDGSYDDSIESLLGEIEGSAAPVIRKLARGELDLTWEERDYLALLMAFQEMRVPWTRQAFQNLEGGILKKLEQFRAHVPGLIESDLKRLEAEGTKLEGVTAESLREYLVRGEFKVVAGPAASLLSMLQLVPVLFSFYREMKWTILRASGVVPFVTSDNPVVRFDPNHREGFYGVGMASPTIETRFPLGTKTCLLVTHDKKRENQWHELVEAGKHDEAEELRQTLPSIELVNLRKEVVPTVNGLAIEFAERFVYSSRKDPFIPEVFKGEPKGMRFQVSAGW